MPYLCQEEDWDLMWWEMRQLLFPLNYFRPRHFKSSGNSSSKCGDDDMFSTNLSGGAQEKPQHQQQMGKWGSSEIIPTYSSIPEALHPKYPQYYLVAIQLRVQQECKVTMPHVQPAELVRGRQSAAVTRDERIARNVLYRGVGGIKTPVLTARTVPQLGR